MNKNQHKTNKRNRRRAQIRRTLVGGPVRPRLAVFKSLNHIYVQVIDDLAGKTLVSASTRDKDAGVDKTGNVAAAAAVGQRLAAKAKAAGVTQVVFDRAGFRYHGRIKALADAARKGGLDF
jgi:large subunit ribosomal protein L18